MTLVLLYFYTYNSILYIIYNIYEDKVADTNLFSDYNVGHSYKLLVNGSALYFGTTPLPGGTVGSFRMLSAL